MDTRQGEERKGKSIKVPSWKYPQALWLQQHKKQWAYLVRELCSHMREAALGACAAAAATTARGVSRWRDCWAPGPCSYESFPHTFLVALWARERGTRMGEPASEAEKGLVICDLLRNQAITFIWKTVRIQLPWKLYTDCNPTRVAGLSVENMTLGFEWELRALKNGV